MFKLGKLAPSKRDSLSFGDFLTVMPTAPLIDFAPDYVYPMDGNDTVGDCVVAGWDHFRQIVTGLLGGAQKNFTQDEIWNFYKTQNPGFDPHGTASTNGPDSNHDAGMIIQAFLEYLVAQKYILGFAKIDYQNDAQMRAAIYLGLGVITGVQLRNAQMQQLQTGTWDFDASSPVEGGHCIPLAGYNNNPDIVAIVTWGRLIAGTRSFVNNQMDEAWFVLMQEHVDHPGFRNHFDLAGFSKAVSDITGGKVVIPVPSGNPTLRLTTPFTKGPAVITLQNNLNANGANLVADGTFGNLTKQAVIIFQKNHGLVADGIVGPATWNSFNVIAIITQVCTDQNIEPLLGIAVASCESSLNPKATLFNPSSNSTDRGIFQWNSKFHSEITDVQAFDPKAATQFFCDAVKAGHLHANWSASEPCWIKKLTPEIKTKYGLS